MLQDQYYYESSQHFVTCRCLGRHNALVTPIRWSEQGTTKNTVLPVSERCLLSDDLRQVLGLCLRHDIRLTFSVDAE